MSPRNFLLLLLATGLFWSGGLPVSAQVLFINEIHYDNVSVDTNEGVEIAGTAGTDLSGYDLVFYNGTGGAQVGTSPVLPLSGTLGNAGAGFGFAWFAKAGIENGPPDGVALVVHATQQVLQFLSWEGSFTAVGGPANGLVSTDILVAETSTTAEGLSLQLKGTGSQYSQFTWAAPAAATRGQTNVGQVLGGTTYQVSFSISPDIIQEVAPGQTATATIAIAPPPASPVLVTLTNSDSTEISIPATVTVPTTGSVTFPVQAVNDGVLDGNQIATVSISLTLQNLVNRSANITVRDSQAPPATTFNGLLRVAAFNVLNGVGTPGSSAYLSVREILQRLNPDIISFEEVDDSNTFSDIKSLLNSLGFGITRANLVWEGDAFVGQAFAPGDFASSGQVVVLASRYPIVETVQIGRGVAGRKEFSRFPLCVKVDVPGVAAAQDPVVIGVHLKASGTDADRYRRAVECFRILQFLTSQGIDGATRNLLIMGDFNEQDEPGQPVSYVSGIDPLTFVFPDTSKLPATYALGADLAGANSQTLTYNLFPHSAMGPLSLASAQPRQADGTATATYNLGGNAKLDYIFVPNWLVTNGLVRAEVYNSRLETAFDGLAKASSLPTAGDLSTVASDHFCVYADLPLGTLPKLNLTLSKNSVLEYDAASVQATVQLSQPAPAGGLDVTLGAFRPAPISLANMLLHFPAGTTTLATSLKVVPNASVSAHREVTVEATASGWFPAEARLAIQNEEPGGLLLFTQYIENAGSGTAPKAVEIKNRSGITLDFSKTPLAVRRFSNGSLTSEQEALVSTGLLGNGQVLVIGDAATGDYLLAQNLILPDPLVTPATALTGHLFYDAQGNIRFLKDSFTYNGDDALELLLDYTRMDVLGSIGQDPGAAWSGNGVATANQNIALKTFLGTGSSGFTDPSTRFQTVSSTDELTGFGVAPQIVDDYLTWAATQGLAGLQLAPEADPDGDGVRNFLEYAFGTPALIPGGLGNAATSLTQPSIGQFRLQATRRSPRPGLAYQWEASTNLAAWSPSSPTPLSQQPVAPDFETLTWSVPVSGTRFFWRLRAFR